MANFDLSALDDVINMLDHIQDKSAEVLAETLNFGAELAMDSAEDAISNELNLKHEYIRSKLSIRKRATHNDFSATVSATRRGVLLPRYDPIQLYKAGKNGQKRAGVSVKIKKSGSRKTIKSAFFIKLKRGKNSGEGAMGLAYRPEDGVALKPEHQSSIDKHGYAVMHAVSVSQALETFQDTLKIDNQALIDFFTDRIKQK